MLREILSSFTVVRDRADAAPAKAIHPARLGVAANYPKRRPRPSPIFINTPERRWFCCFPTPNRDHVRVFTDRKDHHWGRRKPARDR